ncbi:MAG: 4'-phosphopantetheinyl transferase family protein [Chitinophagales bacterium]
MPIFFQHQINETTRLGIWKIEETEEFFLSNVPLQKEVTHPHKRLQHLAGRFLLQFLFPGFPYELIKIADTRKPYLPGEQYHFSISHCGDYAAAIVSSNQRVGIDIEIPSGKAGRIMEKFLTKKEQGIFNSKSFHDLRLTTLLWCCKESVYKWYGDGGVDFRRHIQLEGQNEGSETISCLFLKNNQPLLIHYSYFEHLVLAWVIS